MKINLILAFLFASLSSHAQIAGETLFGETKILDVYLTFDDTDFWDSLEDTYYGDYYISCDVEIDGNLVEQVGIKLKGNSSWGVPSNKKSFKIEFDEFVEGQEYDELEKLVFNNNFKDPTMMREKVFYDFCNTAGIPAPRANFAKVYMNDTYWGLYTLVDEVDKDYLGVLFSDNDGNLYKGDPSGDLVYLGDDASPYYSKYELKTNEDSADWSDLIDFIDRINNSSDADFETLVGEKMDESDFYGHWSALSLFANLDSYLGSGHNYYLYHEPSSDEFKFIIWDGNEAFGNFSNGVPTDELSALTLLYLPAYPKQRPVYERALENDSMKEDYLNTIYLLKEAYFNPSYLYPIISADSALIRDAVFADTQKQYSFSDFETNINYDITPPGGMSFTLPGLKQFIQERYDAVSNELITLGFVPSAIQESSETHTTSVFPTILQKGENISIVTDADEFVFRLVNTSGALIYKTESYNNFTFNTSMLEAGIYFYQIHCADGSGTSGKIEIF